ncbi:MULTISPECIES: CpaF family protein [Actinotignum]|uniref:ATPase, T2SS/T4P/T4SS family n=2 Tax=Actinotignum timonense TaxID=1870995 RepID=A0AAW9HE82_9ACTO|nr:MULTISPECIES: ATPase, T2SS/T4P/T4SS family [Actinotignum]MBS5748187.1 CpaF family protein [Actinotignum schaalii]MDE1558222.1 ATPase, T2SS/T4P/T4SS family [Actinotignum schaalii]MDE1663081.1 ATPase, T2SS/T4P/T4SS family [Actinotignum schaalii]MDK6419454.1 ATPase, T2SS/T4P/T4SS family [Actinotignum timonense]MDK6590036.1 ATPase, T2SS/T4P/T4SS family [Actinotignum timonense]
MHETAYPGPAGLASARSAHVASRAYRPASANRQAIEERVRATIRHRGIDPRRDAAFLANIVGETLSTFNDESVRGEHAALADTESVRSHLISQLSGYGPLQKFFDDPQVEEIWINAPDKIFVARSGVSTRIDLTMTEDEIHTLVERMLYASGRRLDLSTPFVDAQLPTGERLHVAIPDITARHWAINIRKYTVRARQLSDLVNVQMLEEAQADYLSAAMSAGRNILVSGSTGAGKTTLLRALLGGIATTERLISAEEVFELGIDLPDVVAMQTRPPSLEGRGAVTLRDLVRESLRMRPDRIVIGEVRGAEAFDLLVALNAGIPGACTIHANSAREALTKLEILPLLAGENITPNFVTPTVAATINLVIHVSRAASGQRKVAQILEVMGLGPDGSILTRAVS